MKSIGEENIRILFQFGTIPVLFVTKIIVYLNVNFCLLNVACDLNSYVFVCFKFAEPFCSVITVIYSDCFHFKS